MVDADGLAALLEPAGLIDHPGFQGGQVRHRLPAQGRPDPGGIPRTVGQQVGQRLRIDAQAGGHRFDRFALAGQQQAGDVAGSGHAPLAASKVLDHGAEELAELAHAVFPMVDIPFHTERILKRAATKASKYLTQ